MAIDIFRKAGEYAVQSDHPQFRMGAVLTSGKRIVSGGYNYYLKSSPLNLHHWPGTHAEIAALMASRKLPPKLAIWVVRFDNRQSEHFVSSRPCGDCITILASAGVRTMHYIDEAGQKTVETIRMKLNLWSSDEIEFLKQNHNRFNLRVISRMLSRSEISVIRQAERLKIAFSDKYKSMIDPDSYFEIMRRQKYMRFIYED